MSPGRMPDGVLGSAAQLLARRVGLRLDPAIRGRLARSVADEAELRGLDVATYVARLGNDATLLQDLLNRVTVQETAFFRDAGQFEALTMKILPTLTSPVRVWSAGCANGQEPYSLAMALAESGLREWSVVATDISTRALARTRRARYSTREIAGVSEDRRHQHLVRVGADWEVASSLRDRVEVRHHNLVAEVPPFQPAECDVVFCRNVLIYLRPDDVLGFLEQLARWLTPRAWLFLGYSESLWQVTDRFQLIRVDDSFAYRRRDENAPTARPPGRSSPRRDAEMTAPVQTGRSKAPIEASPSAKLRRPPAASAEESADSSAKVTDLLAEGEAAMNAGDYAAAISAFRKSAYLDPDQPVAHLHLGLAMEAAGQAASARRAFAAARAALRRGETASVEAALEGYALTELIQLLDQKLGDAS